MNKVARNSSNNIRFRFLADLNVDNLVKSKLSLHLERTVSGNDQVLLTPIGREHGPENILKEFDSIFNSKTSMSLMNENLVQLELQNRSKYGPRSIAKPWKDRKESVLYSFGEGISIPAYRTEPQFSKSLNKLRPISVDKALSYLKNSTNSGLPLYTKKGLAKSWVSAHFESDLRTEWPCVMFTRTQESGKTRLVWGYPMSLTLEESCFYRPLLDFQKREKWRSALLGPDVVDENVTDLVNSAILRGKSLLSMDFSLYDATAKKNLQFRAFEYIKSLFQKEYGKRLDFIRDRFCNIGLLTPDGVINGPHGVPSGSTFTNEVDSIIQYQLARSSSYVFSENMQIQGDDGLYSISSENADNVYSIFTKCGLKVNKDKTILSPNSCHYLQKLYDPYFRNQNGIIGGIYPVYRAISRLVYPERWVDFEDYGIIGKDYYSIRTICILENCKHHPLFKDLVKFVYDLDKYNLKYSQDGLNKYVSMLTETTGSEGILKNQYGDDIRGISNFETVKLIKELV